MTLAPQPAPWRPELPTTLDGRYALEAEVEALPDGVLYRGRDLGLDESVAITVFHPAFFDGPLRESNVARLRRAARYRHPHLAAVRTMVTDGPVIYLVADPVVGQPLTLWRREASEGVEGAYRVVGQVLEALAVVHRLGVHGAIGPATLRIAEGHAWLSHPFRLEPPPEGPPADLPPARVAWLAPEQLFVGAPEGPSTDVYGVGLVLGFLLARGLTEPGHSLLIQGIDVPPAVDEVYVRATARHPELRPASVAELRAALEAAAGPAWGAAQVALAAPVFELLERTGTSPDALRMDVDEPDGDEPDLPRFGAPPAGGDIERTVEEEAIPAQILDITATGEGLALPLDLDGILEASVLELLPLEETPPPLDGTAPPIEEEAPPLDAVPEALIGPEIEAVTGGQPPPSPQLLPLPPPLPADAPLFDTRRTQRPGHMGPPRVEAPRAADQVTPVPAEPAAPDDTGERIAITTNGASWTLGAKLLSEAVRTGSPIEHVVTMLSPEPAPVGSGSQPAAAPEPPVTPAVSPSIATPEPPASPAAPGAVATPTPPPAPLAPPALPFPPLRSPGPDAEGEEDAEGDELGRGSAASPLLGPPGPPPPGPPSPNLSNQPDLPNQPDLADLPDLKDVALGPLPFAAPPSSTRGLIIAAVILLVAGGVLAFALFGGEPSTVTSQGADGHVASADALEGGLAAVGSPDVVEGVVDIEGIGEGALGASVASDRAESPEPDGAASGAVVDDPDDPGDPADPGDPDDPSAASTDDELDDEAGDSGDADVAEDEPADDAAGDEPPDEAAGDEPAPTEGQAFVPTDWQRLDCPAGMAKIRRKIEVVVSGAKFDDWQVHCIDRYESPGAGQLPQVNVDLGAARAACAARGKRLCSRAEWRRACGGKYPYGGTYDPTACNTLGEDGMPRPLVATGSKPRCKSGWGTFDMVGNAAEWTSDGFVNGGSAYRHGEAATCGQSSRRAGGHPYVGFRCCADAR